MQWYFSKEALKSGLILTTPKSGQSGHIILRLKLVFDGIPYECLGDFLIYSYPNPPYIASDEIYHLQLRLMWRMRPNHCPVVEGNASVFEYHIIIKLWN